MNIRTSEYLLQWMASHSSLWRLIFRLLGATGQKVKVTSVVRSFPMSTLSPRAYLRKSRHICFIYVTINTNEGTMCLPQFPDPKVKVTPVARSFSFPLRGSICPCFRIVPFHNDFFPLAVSNLNNVNQLIRYNNQMTVVELLNVSQMLLLYKTWGYYSKFDPTTSMGDILGRELGPSGVSPNQRSRWKHALSLLKHV